MAFMTVEQRKRVNMVNIMMAAYGLTNKGQIPLIPADKFSIIEQREIQSEESKRAAIQQAADKRKARAMKRIQNFNSSRRGVSC